MTEGCLINQESVSQQYASSFERANEVGKQRAIEIIDVYDQVEAADAETEIIQVGNRWKHGELFRMHSGAQPAHRFVGDIHSHDPNSGARHRQRVTSAPGRDIERKAP